ncbi:myo-inositol-1(or 4)-monophosphatase [Pilibacter termitis]|uniref:Myo-inositol-1(Or 4)-monophosphatase n=1 Tax=Pilibacter termitis TaxID=263852 RepID=A0A1T4MEQ0_9ENTE|nr:inositol monophosphatase family protein [Pilibacter termitis]SJZ65248.1 myo-inositol-1(or 4)-monophosphatase [Pilibacter termitis]
MERNQECKLVKEWIVEVGNYIRTHIHESFEVAEKENRQDIVTEMDKKVQNLLLEKIRTTFPEDKVLAEENGLSEIEEMSGRLWIIDPIDGTLNFYFQRENFAIMVALFEDGIGQLGFIYDVMNEQIYWGGKNIGVYRNDERLMSPKNTALSNGLLGINAFMYAENIEHTRDIADKSMGVRVYGSAAIEFIHLLHGRIIAYLSNLAPWDWAAGSVLAEELGLEFSALNGGELSFDTRSYYIVGTKELMKEVRETYMKC